MSLVTTPTLRVLYNLANTIGAKEHASTTFWNHWLNKIIFPEEHFVVAPERPPSNDNEDGNRRVDFIVGFADVSQLRFIYIFEGKKAKGGITAAESQVQEASAACCRRGGSVWSMTAVGTKARIWKYTTVPVSSLGSVTAYIDADSPQASQLSSNMMVVKSMMAPQSDFILKSQPSVTTTQRYFDRSNLSFSRSDKSAQSKLQYDPCRALHCGAHGREVALGCCQPRFLPLRQCQ
jgi:hypothetical protein